MRDRGLVLAHIHAGYGKQPVLFDVSLEVEPGEVVALLGRNGAGKSTTLRSVMGLVQVQKGQILFGGVELNRLPPHRIPTLGVAYLPQGSRVFPALTVRENLSIALTKPWGTDDLQRAGATFADLPQRLGQRAGTLSGGEQQLLALARAFLVRPKLLLLDEPTEGLMPKLVAAVLQTVSQFRRNGVAVLLAEQKLDAALAISDRVYVIEKGAVTYTALTAKIDLPWLRSHLGTGI